MANWSITNCDRKVSTGYINVVHWTCSAVDGEFSASVYSTCSFEDGTPVVPYDQVTEAEVLNWIWSNGVDKQATEEAVNAQLQAQKNPVSASGVPWAQE